MSSEDQSLPRSISIRYSLLRNLIVLIVLTAGSILLVSILGSYASVDNLSAILVDQSAERTRAELQRFFSPVTANLRIASAWGQQGRVDPTDVEALNRHFMPVLSQLPQVSSMLVARDDGTEYLLLEDPDGWRNRETRPGEWGTRTRWRTWRDEYTPLDEEWRELNYDPRLRPWFQGAMWNDEGEIFWTEPYVFFTTKDPGITASIRWNQSGDDEKSYVTAFDVTLTDISRFTSSLQVSANGMAVVYTESGRVVGLPRSEAYQSEAQIRSDVLRPVDSLGIPALTDAVTRWERNGRPSDQAFQFSSGDEAWWAGITTVSSSGNKFWIATLVPEFDFMGEVERQRNIILLITLLALLIAVAMALYLARSYGRPLEALSVQSTRIRNLDLQPVERVESRLQEVRQLADAQDQMLNALQSFARYVPVDVVKQLVKRGEMAEISARSAELTVLFTDIQGFTGISETLSPKKLTLHMSEYFEAVLEVLQGERGTVDKLVGDAVVAFWGAPNRDDWHARHAVRAVLRCVTRIEELNERWSGEDLPPLPTRFGLNTGSLMVGNMGAPNRLNYTVLGDTVNLASRLEGLNKHYGTVVLATESVKLATGSEFEWRLVDRVAVKGRMEAVLVYEPLGLAEEVSAVDKRWARQFEAALREYQGRRFAVAAECLEGLGAERPEDLSVQRLLRLCQELVRCELPDNWDGQSRFDTK